MNRLGIAAIVLLGITLTPTVAAPQGIYEYWKAGTKRSRSKAALPSGHARAGASGASAPSAPARAITPWTPAWFSDSTLVRRRIGEMTEAMTVPMIGQTFPLPRGGGFVCTRREGGEPPAESGLTCVIECAGPELGGRRHNWFYAGGASGTPTLDRVRWLILAPPSSAGAPWRAFVRAVADSLSREMGPPAWAGPDSTVATWRGLDYRTTVRLHGDSARVDSLEVECVSERLASAHVAGR
ncbi:MAG TPA: hypothetical protein VFS09_04975 [Candidatus Eisenbacteria bacterium]|nr:hypothetical protein [Candidatus Eisenbacteria bacterium]